MARLGGTLVARSGGAVALMLLLTAPTLPAYPGPSDPASDCGGFATSLWFGEGHDPNDPFAHHANPSTYGASDLVCLGWAYNHANDAMTFRLQVADQHDLGDDPGASVTYHVRLHIEAATGLYDGSLTANWNGITQPTASFNAAPYAEPGTGTSYDADVTWLPADTLQMRIQGAWFQANDEAYHAQAGDRVYTGATSTEDPCISDCHGDGRLESPTYRDLPEPPPSPGFALSLSHHGTNNIKGSPGQQLALPVDVYNGMSSTKIIAFTIAGEATWNWQTPAPVTLPPGAFTTIIVTGTVPAADARSALTITGDNGHVTEDAAWLLEVPVRLAIQTVPDIREGDPIRGFIDATFHDGSPASAAIGLHHEYAVLDAVDQVAGGTQHEGHQAITPDDAGRARFTFTADDHFTVQLRGTHRLDASVAYGGATFTASRDVTVRP